MSYSRGPIGTVLTTPYWVIPEGMTNQLRSVVSVPVAAAWPTNNKGIYVPFSVPRDVTCNGVRFIVGSGNAAGRTVDLAFYDVQTLERLSSQGPVDASLALNTWACNQVLQGGHQYYLAMSCSSTSLVICRLNTAAEICRGFGFAEQTSVATLPDPGVPVAMATAYWPMLTLTFAEIPCTLG